MILSVSDLLGVELSLGMCGVERVGAQDMIQGTEWNGKERVSLSGPEFLHPLGPGESQLGHVLEQ